MDAEQPTAPTLLLPCPFCGGTDPDAGVGDYEWAHVTCQACEAQSVGRDVPRAIAAWNKRAPPVPASGDVEALSKILAAVQALTPTPQEDEEGAGSGYWTCPMCDGEGSVDGPRNVTTCGAAGLQVYGIGDDMKALEAWVTEAPALVASLLKAHPPALPVASDAMGAVTEDDPRIPLVVNALRYARGGFADADTDDEKLAVAVLEALAAAPKREAKS